MMMPICFNYFKVDADLSLFTAEGELEENIAIELRLNFDDEGAIFVMDFHTELNNVQGAVGNILDGQEIEGIYIGGSMDAENFQGGLYATTVEHDGEFINATRHPLAEWDGSPQEECE